MAGTTKTLNPLHFEDLEPHRFEDMVRQLAYDFRTWRSLEALGRSGSDDGIDILGQEIVGIPQEASERDDGPEEADDAADAPVVRPWVIQCKREKQIGPTKARGIVEDFFEAHSGIDPYGYILAAACDFSKDTRDNARDQLTKHGIQEVHFWGKGELEDMLLQPKNDHLLFAYFGISLQIRRRSMRTELRSRLTLKRKLAKVLGSVQSEHYKPVFIRDPNDDKYPYIESVEQFVKNPPWRYWEFRAHEPPDHLSFSTGKFFAYVNWETEEWDVFDEAAANLATVGHPLVYGLDYNSFDPNHLRTIAQAWWELKVPQENRCYEMRQGLLEYERVLAVDELGDHANEGPHLLVEYVDGHPFIHGYRWLQADYEPGMAAEAKRLWSPAREKRIKFFPHPIPDVTKEYHEHATKQRAERAEKEAAEKDKRRR